jgi:hypothetical protein
MCRGKWPFLSAVMHDLEYCLPNLIVRIDALNGPFTPQSIGWHFLKILDFWGIFY